MFQYPFVIKKPEDQYNILISPFDIGTGQLEQTAAYEPLTQ